MMTVVSRWNRPCSSRSISPTPIPPGPQQQTRRTLLQRTNGTDRRTDTVPFRGPCSAYYAGSTNNHDYGLTGITTSSDVWRRVQEVGAVFSEWPQLLLAYDVVWAALSLFVPLVIHGTEWPR